MLIIRGRLRRWVVGLTGFAVICTAGWVAFFRSTTVERYESTRSLLLDRVLPEIYFAALPADQALQFVGDQASLQLCVDWDALKAVGVERTTPITVRLRNVKAGKAINALLKEACGNVDDAPCQYHMLDSGEILITTQPGIAAFVVERRYDLRPVMFRFPVMNCFGDDNSPPEENIHREELTDAVSKLIEDTVDSDSWQRNGGKIGTIRWENGWIVVRQTPENHRALVRLIQQLAETRIDVPLVWIERSLPRP